MQPSIREKPSCNLYFGIPQMKQLIGKEANYKLQAKSHKLQAASHKLQAASKKLQAKSKKQKDISCKLTN
jgi:division protein CdvB (Snf7/Vps24/ESCRT-III family)